jgi:hypothetical protein
MLDEKKQALKVDMGAAGTKTVKMGFPSNSHKDKEEQKKPEPAKVQKVVTGKVTHKKKSLGKRFMDTFISDDISNVKSYIVHGVLVPAAKDTITDIVQGVMDAIKTGLEVALFGEQARTSRGRDRGRTSYVSYDRYSSRDKKDDRRESYAARNRATHNFDDIVFETRNDAEEVLNSLIDYIEKYDEASVAVLYDLVGVTESFTDHKYGWRNLSSASVSRTRDGYVLNLPRPLLLE